MEVLSCGAIRVVSAGSRYVVLNGSEVVATYLPGYPPKFTRGTSSDALARAYSLLRGLFVQEPWEC